MASLRHIRRRIKFTQSTQQIVRAMQLVSASKLKRTQDRLLQARLVAGYLSELVARIGATQPIAHPLCERREGGPTALIVITSDAGLSGAYNANVIHLADAHLQVDRAAWSPRGKPEAPLRRPSILRQAQDRGERPRGAEPTTRLRLAQDDPSTPRRHPESFGSAQDSALSEVERAEQESPAKAGARVEGSMSLVLIGKKGFRYFSKRGAPIVSSHVDLAGRPNPERTQAIASSLIDAFLAKQFSTVQIAYTRFISAAVSRPAVEPWLPLPVPEPSGGVEYIFEPSPARVLNDVVPRLALAMFQQRVLEAFTSEHGARMVAMKNATDNAEELLGALTLVRNKVRQAAITKELSEIVGTAEALK